MLCSVLGWTLLSVLNFVLIVLAINAAVEEDVDCWKIVRFVAGFGYGGLGLLILYGVAGLCG
jgi:hypothetical protein